MVYKCFLAGIYGTAENHDCCFHDFQSLMMQGDHPICQYFWDSLSISNFLFVSILENT